MRPYNDAKEGKFTIRKFPASSPIASLVWHRDSKDRLIKVIEGVDWEIQFENELPVPLLEGVTYWIEKDEWHRIKRGSSDLLIAIEEF